jgi:hypothetical protein
MSDRKPTPENKGVPVVFDNGRPEPQWLAKWEEISGSLKTGDLILQQGVSPTSQAIQMLEGSVWTHSCMVVRPSDINVSVKGDPLCYWESNDILTCNDVITGKPKEGPTLVVLEERLWTNMENTFDYGILIRHLVAERSKDVLSGLADYIPKVHKYGFPKDGGLQSWIAARTENMPNTSTEIFCSELVASSMMHMGLLSTRFVPNAYTPGDLSAGDTLPMLQRSRLLDRILVDPESVKQPT